MLRKKLFCLNMAFSFALLSMTNVYSSDCGILLLQQDRSQGAHIIGDPCRGSGQLNLDSVVQLDQGSRAWLETIPTVTASPKFQIICQNLSSTNLKIKVSSHFLPWIKADDSLVKCNDWINEQMECKEIGRDKTVLICGIASRKPLTAADNIKMGTSIVMRQLAGK